MDQIQRRRPTLKQRLFAQEYVQSGNGTQSAIKIYNTKSTKIAEALASENLRKPVVREEIELLLKSAGLSREEIAMKLSQAIEAGLGTKATNADSLRGLELAAKLGNMFPANRSIKASVNLTEVYKAKSHQELIKELEIASEKNKKLLDDLGTS